MTEQLSLMPRDTAETYRLPFRSLHYLGSKARLLEPISEAIAEVATGTDRVCDLFSGSGVVAARLAREWSVTAVDIQEYSRVLCAAVLECSGLPDDLGPRIIEHSAETTSGDQVAWAFQPLVQYERECLDAAAVADTGPLADLLEHGSVLGADATKRFPRGELGRRMRLVVARFRRLDAHVRAHSTITYYYGGVYFSYAQALAIDRLRFAMTHFPRRLADAAVAALLAAATDVVTSVGNQFAQPLKPRDGAGRVKPAAVRRALRQRALDLTEYFVWRLGQYSQLPQLPPGNRAFRLDYREFLRSCDATFAAMYADPPYTRDHYSRFYHVLETIALADNPKIDWAQVDRQRLLSRGIYRAERHQSPFCIKSQAPSAFAALFEGVRAIETPLVVSYSPYDSARRTHPRLLEISTLISLARKWFRHVRAVTVVGVSHSKLNSASRSLAASRDAEVLIVCRP